MRITVIGLDATLEWSDEPAQDFWFEDTLLAMRLLSNMYAVSRK